MKKRAFIIHGWEGTPNGSWKPWLKQELEKEEFEVIVPSMPHSAHPKMDEWLEHLQNIVGTVDDECYFVGHSLGCIAILRYLERLQTGKKVSGVVLVAGFTSNLGYEDLNSFFPNNGRIDWEKIKSHCNQFAAIHSDNDPVVSTHYGEEFFQNILGAEYILQHNKKHFGSDDGITELPIVLEIVLKMSR